MKVSLLYKKPLSIVPSTGLFTLRPFTSRAGKSWRLFLLPGNRSTNNTMGNIKKKGVASPGRGFRLHPDVIAQTMGDSTFLLLHVGTGHFYEMNKSATRLWELLAEGKDLKQVQNQMLLEYDISAAKLEKEFAKTLAILEKEKLIIGDE